MNPEPIYNHAAINEAIAKRCGFVWVDSDGVCSPHYYKKDQEGIWSDIPSYTTSHDAMAEARKVLTHPEDQAIYGGELFSFCPPEAMFMCGEELFEYADQPALHHAIAFCKACGIWDEEKMIKKEI